MTAMSLITVIGIAGAAMQAAHADQGLVPYVTAIPRLDEADTLTFGVFQVERYDSNFFRLPDGVNPTGDSTRRSAVTSVTGVGVNLDKSYGLQRLVVNASTSREFYSPYGNLDDTGSRINSTLYWSITPNLTGNLVFDYSRVPTDYEFLGFVTTPNPRTSRSTRLNVDFRPGAALHPRISLFENRDESQNTTFQLQNSRSAGVETALLYDFVSNNRVGVFANRAKGEDLNDQDSSLFAQSNSKFRQSEYGIMAEWRASGQTAFTGRIGRAVYTSETTSGASFNGFIGDLNYKYALTGKTGLQITARRQLFSSLTAFSSFVQEDALLAKLVWAVTGKVTISPQFNIRRQNYKDSPVPSDLTLVQTTRYFTAQVDWAALRSTDFSFSLSHSSRSATTDILRYKDNNASVFARFKF